MATVTWRGGSGLWSNQNNWFTYLLPGTADTLLFAGSTAYASTVDIPFTVGSVDVSGSAVTLDVAAALTATDGISVASGSTVVVAGTLAGGPLDLSAGGALAAAGGTLEGTTYLRTSCVIAGVGRTPGLTNTGTITMSPASDGGGQIDFAGFDVANAGAMLLQPVTVAESGNFVVDYVPYLHGIAPAYSELYWNQAQIQDLLVTAPVFDNSGQIVEDGGTLTVVPDGNGGSVVEVACFLAGTRIATPTGEVAVDTLRPGDTVLTASGRVAPVRWAGCTFANTGCNPTSQRIAPIRIRAGAFGPRRPARDLYVSPDHAIWRDGVLIPAARLVDGAAVVRADGMADLSYWHVELDRDDVLLAEGLPCESFLDTGQLASFGMPAGFCRYLWDGDACAALALAGPAARSPSNLISA